MAQVRPHLMEEAGRENLPSQQLGVDDLVAVSVYDAPELTRTVRVEADGTIHLPMLTEGVKAVGLFPRDVEGSLVDALKSEQILVDPVVKVTVAEYHSRPISVMGAVRKPLTFQAIGAVTLLDALARAEGLSPDAGTEVLVSRPQPSPDSRGEVTATLVERIPLNRLLKDADPCGQLPTARRRGNSRARSRQDFRPGQCKETGSFPVHDAGDNSVLKMVALSEGVLPYAGEAGVHLPARCQRRQARNPGRVRQNHAAQSSRYALASGRRALYSRQQVATQRRERDRPHHRIRRLHRLGRLDLALVAEHLT